MSLYREFRGPRKHQAGLIVLLFLVLSSLLHAETGITYERSLVQDGFLRTYLLYVPESYTGEEEWPLVINYHGYTLNAYGQMQVTEMNRAADKARVLVAYPQGLIVQQLITDLLPPSAFGWNVPGNFSADQDDVAFTESLIDDVAADFNVDLARVHATGWSNGSMMSFYLACALPDRIASAAGVSGGLSYLLLDTCQPERPVSILDIFGTADPFFPVEGTALAPPIAANSSFFAAFNGCSADPVVTEYPDKVSEDNSTVTRFRYIRCDDRSQVFFYQVNNGGHAWPGGAPLPPFLGNRNMDLDASSLILKFFKRNPHPWMHDDPDLEDD